jgi:hypothetical protein
VKHPACERREQTGRAPKGRVPKGCDGAAAHNPYTFTGRRLDPESGLMQYGHRYYSPTQVPPCQDRECGTRHYPPRGQ